MSLDSKHCPEKMFLTVNFVAYSYIIFLLEFKKNKNNFGEQGYEQIPVLIVMLVSNWVDEIVARNTQDVSGLPFINRLIKHYMTLKSTSLPRRIIPQAPEIIRLLSIADWQRKNT